MSETIITAIISAASTLLVSFGTWHFSMKKERDKSTEEIKAILETHREEYLGKIDDVKEDISCVNSNFKQEIAVMTVKMDTLSERVDKHNNIVERTYKLEEITSVHSEKISVANHRIDDLEHKAV